jgi:hypothetical protein
MILTVDHNTRIRDLQAAFNEVFQFLRLEFFRNPHQPHQPSPKKDMRSPDDLALTADKRHIVAELSIDNQWKVAELEELFAREAGLNVQVFRRSGNVWIETTFTDDWTLEQQNKEGELLSIPFPTRTFGSNS